MWAMKQALWLNGHGKRILPPNYIFTCQSLTIVEVGCLLKVLEKLTEPTTTTATFSKICWCWFVFSYLLSYPLFQIPPPFFFLSLIIFSLSIPLLNLTLAVFFSLLKCFFFLTLFNKQKAVF